MTDLAIANEIRAQLGRGFAIMTGAKSFVGGENFLQFSLPSGFASKKINKVKIILTPFDTYTMEFYYIRGINCELIATREDVYNEDLQNIFTSETARRAAAKSARNAAARAIRAAY